jgi:hypothetical protein
MRIKINLLTDSMAFSTVIAPLTLSTDIFPHYLGEGRGSRRVLEISTYRHSFYDWIQIAAYTNACTAQENHMAGRGLKQVDICRKFLSEFFCCLLRFTFSLCMEETCCFKIHRIAWTLDIRIRSEMM